LLKKDLEIMNRTIESIRVIDLPFFKEYYKKKKLGLLKKDKIPQSILIIERNVRVTF
jgi:hypothetical protein